MDGLNEADLIEIRKAFEKNSPIEAIHAMEIALERLGYKRMDRISQYDIYLSNREDKSELDARLQLLDILKKKAEEGGD